MQITLEPDKKYTATEICEIIIEVLEDIIPYLLSNNKKFYPTDLYWNITNLLRYINRNVNGEFKLRSVKKNNWEVIYIDEKMAKRKAKEEAKEQMVKAADYIQRITGERPKWAKDLDK